MKTKKLFTKEKLLLLALFAFILVSCNLDESTRFAVQGNAGNTAEAVYGQNGTHGARGYHGAGEPLIDIEMEDGTFGWDPVLYERQQAEQEARAKADVEAGALQLFPRSGIYGDLDDLHPATKTTDLITIIIIADRYTDTQQETFFASAQNMANYIVDYYPISEYKDWIQIYAIGTISPSQNISIIAGDGSAGGRWDDITITKIRPFVQNWFPNVLNPSIENNHTWLVMQNGAGGGYAHANDSINAGVAVTSPAAVTGLHEMGHIWGLWDEYDTSSSYYRAYRNGPNIRSNVNLANPTVGILDTSYWDNTNTAIPPEWGLFIGASAGANNQWVGFDGIGIYQMDTYGWGNTVWYRSHQDECPMKHGGSNYIFCHVCAEHLARRFAPNRDDNTRVRGYAYAGSTETSITIGSSVTGIGDYAFIGAAELKIIKNHSATPQPINTTTFAGLNRANITVNVPMGTAQDYKNAGWTGFILTPDGDGTVSAPYQISSKQHLEAIPSVDDIGVHFKLLYDIDLLGETWTPLPNFLGIFDGYGNTIYGLYAEQPQGFIGGCGLFEENSGTVKNLHVKGTVVAAQNIFAGTIAGINSGLIQNCTSGPDTGGRNLPSRTGSDARSSVIFDAGSSTGGRDIVSPSKHGNSFAGGITGYNLGTVDNCVNNGYIQGMHYVGGLVGYNDWGIILNSSNIGDVSGYMHYVGGVTGYNSYGEVLNSFNTGYVNGNYDYTGGVAGCNFQGTVTGCYNTGYVYGREENVGGVVGYEVYGTVSHSYNTGNIDGSNNTGGVVGYNSGGTVEKSYNTGNVTSSGGDSTGGIAGYIEGGSIVNSYNTGAVSGYFYTGGIAGLNVEGIIAYCYNSGGLQGGFTTCGIAGQYYGAGGISNNLSLGKHLSGVARGSRVFYDSMPPYDGNKARNDMIVTIAGSYLNDGIDVALGTAMSSVFSGWNTGVWSIPSGNLIANGALPVLLNMPTGAQNPTLVP